MNEREQQIVLAEFDEWTNINTEFSTEPFGQLMGTRPITRQYIPDYLYNLNSVRGLRRNLNQAQKVDYLNNLRALLTKKLGRKASDFDLIDAEACDHCIAIINAIGKWKD